MISDNALLGLSFALLCVASLCFFLLGFLTGLEQAMRPGTGCTPHGATNMEFRP